MSQCIVPNWNLNHQRQEQVEEEEEAEQGNRSSHVLNPSNTHLVPMSNYEVAELTWENGQLAMHGLGGLLPSAPTKPTWGRSSDTLESIVHQATCHSPKPNFNLLHHDRIIPAPNRNNPLAAAAASSGGNWAESASRLPVAPAAAATAALLKKWTRSESDHCRKFQDERSACASASATFCRDNDTTMMTWASHESPRSMKTMKTADEDSACHDGSENRDEDRETRTETGRSHSTSRRSRAAAIHNLSERRRRDRINQKMKTLQKLVPNSSKTDKASMLDEVIEYLKQLQAQLQMMSMRSSMPQMNMMMPLGMQQHLQMSLLARMGMGLGMGMGMGMMDMNSMARNASQPLMHPSPVTAHPSPTFLPPTFVPPPMLPTRGAPQPNSNATSNPSLPLPDPYCAFLAQSMNMDLYSKMAALYRPQMNQTTQTTASSPSRSNNIQED